MSQKGNNAQLVDGGFSIISSKRRYVRAVERTGAKCPIRVRAPRATALLPARAHQARERNISFPLGWKNKAVRGEEGVGGGVDCGTLANNTVRLDKGGAWV